MGSRSRKRVREPAPAPVAREEPVEPRGSTEELLTRGQKRAIEDDRLRASLEPLAPGERPTPLLVAIAIATILGLSNLVLGLTGFEVDGTKPSFAGVLGFSGIVLIAAGGMWAKRYWAVLGFQCLLAIVAVIFCLFLLRASSVSAVLIALFFIVAPGWLFWKLVRVLARMQVPERPTRR